MKLYLKNKMKEVEYEEREIFTINGTLAEK
jgi:hypothetical protein